MEIPIVTHCKYLGVIMSEHNSDNDLKRQMRKFYANANMLIRKFSKCSVNVKCYLFKTYCSTGLGSSTVLNILIIIIIYLAYKHQYLKHNYQSMVQQK